MSARESGRASLRPTDLRSLRDAVLDTPGPVAIAGAGTATGWAGSLGPVDAVLDTTGLTGVITHNPGDMTVAVRAGTPLRALTEELAPHGQHVASDAARVADGATVGGVFATADAGPAALAYGSLRDLVIGVTVVLADGTVARSGGHVIKNVAGYDLAKLLHGSYGTLGVVAEVVLRLHPVPKATTTVAVECDLAEASRHAEHMRSSGYEPTALEWTSDGLLLTRIDADESAARLLGTDDSAVRGTDVWERHASLVRGAPRLASLRIGVRPSRLPAVLSSLPAATVTAGLATGVATVTLEPDAVAEAHTLVHAAGGTSVLRARPAGTHPPAWGPAPSALGVLRAVKTELDPRGRFGPGRFAPWLVT